MYCFNLRISLNNPSLPLENSLCTLCSAPLVTGLAVVILVAPEAASSPIAFHFSTSLPLEEGVDGSPEEGVDGSPFKGTGSNVVGAPLPPIVLIVLICELASCLIVLSSYERRLKLLLCSSHFLSSSLTLSSSFETEL